MPNRFWRPDDDAPRLYEWWEPLHRFAALARAERVVWDVHPEHFDFFGRIERPGRLTVHIFEHRVTLLPLSIDHDGVPFRRTRAGSFLRGGTLSTALWRAGVPQLQMAENPPVGDDDRDDVWGDGWDEPRDGDLPTDEDAPAVPVPASDVRSGLRLLIVE